MIATSDHKNLMCFKYLIDKYSNQVICVAPLLIEKYCILYIYNFDFQYCSMHLPAISTSSLSHTCLLLITLLLYMADYRKNITENCHQK